MKVNTLLTAAVFAVLVSAPSQAEYKSISCDQLISVATYAIALREQGSMSEEMTAGYLAGTQEQLHGVNPNEVATWLMVVFESVPSLDAMPDDHTLTDLCQRIKAANGWVS